MLSAKMCACALPLSSSSHWKKLLGGGVDEKGSELWAEGN